MHLQRMHKHIKINTEYISGIYFRVHWRPNKNKISTSTMAEHKFGTLTQLNDAEGLVSVDSEIEYKAPNFQG